MDLLQQIQADLLNDDVNLSAILRKAKVLANQLKSKELRNWASQELDGYPKVKELPDYRIIRTSCYGSWTNGYWLVENKIVPLYKIPDKDLVEHITKYYLCDGIRTVEEFYKSEGGHFFLQSDVTSLVNHHVSEMGYSFAQIQLAIKHEDFGQVLDTVRNRLLDFVLELGESWHIEEKQIPSEELRNLVSVMIYNNQQGGNMAPVFDQRGQSVQNQYNAGGTINFNQAETREALIEEIAKVVREIDRAKNENTIDQDTAIEAEYHLVQATKEAQREKPSKRNFLEHVGKAKSLLGDVKSAVVLAKALMEACEVAKKIFP